MFNLSDTCKKLILCDAVCAAVLFIIGLSVIMTGFFNESVMSYIIGMIFGTVFTLLKIMLLEKSVQRAVDMPAEDSRNYMRLNYMTRYFLTAVIVVAAIFVRHIGLLGVLLGLFSMTPAAFITGKLDKNTEGQ